MNNLTDERREQRRDTFAAAALGPFIGPPSASAAFATRAEKEEIVHDKLAAEAYRWADAMLKVRDANGDFQALK